MKVDSVLFLLSFIEGTSSEKKESSLKRSDESTDKAATDDSQTETEAMIIDESATSENKVLPGDNAAGDANNTDQPGATVENTGEMFFFSFSISNTRYLYV